MGMVIPKEIEELGEFYDIELSAGDYLAYNDQLIPFLIEMAPVLASHFPGCPLRLHLERDPETGREEDLWALAMWSDSKNWRVASESLDRFRREWWFERSPRVARHLAVNFEFAEVEAEVEVAA